MWLHSLDKVIRARIEARVFSFELGNLGDYKPLKGGVYEARLMFGSGYRIYFGLTSGECLVLLTGGDKSTQSKDIRQAKEYWLDYHQRR